MTDPELDAVKIELLRAVCTEEGDQASLTAAYLTRRHVKWYFEYLGGRLQLLPFEQKQRLRSLSNDSAEAVGFYQLLSTVALHLSNTDRPSLKSIGEGVLTKRSFLKNENGSTKPSMQDDITDESMQRLVFSTIGWLTMLYEPNVKSQSPYELTIVQPIDRAGKIITTDTFQYYRRPLEELAELPIHQVLKHFGQQLIPCSWLWIKAAPQTTPADIFSEQLVVNYLNFRTLVKVATVELEFVSSLSLHLEFDEESRRLKIFRYPSWCRLVLSESSSGNLVSRSNSEKTHYLSGLFQSYYTSQRAENDESEHYNPRKHQVRGLCREILLSYRLIFGQDQKSPSLFLKKHSTYLKHRQENKSLLVDPLLRDLCGSHWTKAQLYTEIEAPRAKPQYSARKDFPFLRERLVTLQRFVVEQDPSDLMTLLHDRRDVLRYWTFWAVVLVGGTSIVLSALQITIGILQLVLKQ